MLRSRTSPIEPPRHIAPIESVPVLAKTNDLAQQENASALGDSTSGQLAALTIKPILIQGPSITELEALASWSPSNIRLTMKISEFGLVEKIETLSDTPVPTETLAGVKRAFSVARFIPARRNSTPVKSIVTITVTLEPAASPSN